MTNKTALSDCLTCYDRGGSGLTMAELQASGFRDCGAAIALPKDAIAEFCARWKIEELYLFGSVLRKDFCLNSDVDMMVTFSPSARWSLFDLVEMKEELEKACLRKVDLVTKASIQESKNWIRRQEILDTARLFYVSG